MAGKTPPEAKPNRNRLFLCKKERHFSPWCAGSGWLLEARGNARPRRMVIQRRKAWTKPGLQAVWPFKAGAKDLPAFIPTPQQLVSPESQIAKMLPQTLTWRSF